MDSRAFEKLGVFYLGRLRAEDGSPGDDPLLLYDSRHLTTHAVCVGMTGSGKTGLCIDLLEEAALDGVPAIAIDPKGDLGNLLLTFPDLRTEDFRPWVEEEAARRNGLDPDAFAAAEAKAWREGLAAWGQEGERIRRLKDAAEFTIYTPGSTAGVPVSILRSLEPPPVALREDAELLGERIRTAVSGLLGLLGVDADPIRSREHVLVSMILHERWRAGAGLDLAGLVQAIRDPGLGRVGVLDLEAFYPAKERFDLAQRVNNVLAAPSFGPWLEGEPLDVDRLLWSADGRPRVSIVSIAHLGDAERVFVVALLLNEIVGWVRAQPGTSSLRAILYMDEIFGFFPPVANPASKAPLLTLLKQARAHGLGVVLATQNPVDLDYKGLSNAGTWFLGRLQTERDKDRVLEGLEGLEGGIDRARADAILSSLEKRVFLLHDVHEPEPVVFESRWAMSYLRGPLTRAEIRRLSGTAARHAPDEHAAALDSAAAAEIPPRAPAGSASRPPVLPPGVSESYAPARANPDAIVYQPSLLGIASVRFEHAKADVRAERRIVAAAPFAPGGSGVDWGAVQLLALDPADLESRPAPGAAFADLPPDAADPKRYAAWTKAWADWLYRGQELKVWRSPSSGIHSQPGEDERAFRIRLQQETRESRDAAADALRARWEKRLAAARDRARGASEAVDREADQARHEKLQTAISVGATVLGSVFGRARSSVGRATTAARGASRAMRQAQDVERAKQKEDRARGELEDLEAEFRRDLDGLEDRTDPAREALEPVVLRPRRRDVTVERVGLVWLPWKGAERGSEPAW